MASTERCESKLSLVSNLSMIVSDTPSKHLVEVKSFLNPPEGVKDTMEACLLLLGDIEKAGGDSWKQAKKTLGAPGQLKIRITNLNPDTVTDQRKKAARDILAKYDHDSMMKISNAMTSLYDWAKAVAE
ncbi:cytoplasmic dynein 2 heavy chain 1-like [Mya arenaria]|uniref:cytoplasmic dynein 2 heavy chain 1-like n=1 Tax=Mya arenaria TaxID=6604 RepID=UPI0022E3F8B6|nr:cytoplasmic dynein 2 heavy chain 1-like [Mya arenaria]